MQGNTESETDIEHEPETDNEFTMEKWQRIYRRENMKCKSEKKSKRILLFAKRRSWKHMRDRT